jgi:hypothetical protein
MRGVTLTRRQLLAALTALLGQRAAHLEARTVETLVATGGVPAHVAGIFEEPVAFQRATDGTHYVFDRRAHTVYRLPIDLSTATPIVQVGFEEGRLLDPSAFTLGTDGWFVVADAPQGRERVQLFDSHGVRIAGFNLPGRAAPRVSIGAMVLNGVGSLAFTGRSVLINQPETGSLVTEYSMSGTPLRTFGHLRQTGFERDRAVHLAMNVGIPLLHPHGGFWFVFVAGIPLIRRYTAQGTVVFERILQGPELDPVRAAQATTWPRRTVYGEEIPLVPPVVRAAAVRPTGQLWVSFVIPHTYVVDPDGDQVRCVQFKAAGIVSPTSLSFASGARLLVTPGLYEFRV